MSQDISGHPWIHFLQRRVLPVLAAISDNAYLSAIRAGMVSVVPLTIIGSLFAVLSNFPNERWNQWMAPYVPLLQVPYTATFGLLGLFACFAIAYDLGNRFKQTAIVSATSAVVVFLMTQLQLKDASFNM